MSPARPAAASDLAGAVSAMCVDPGEPARARALAALETAHDARQRAQVVRLGPVFEGERAARTRFWPDRHGTGRRRLARAFAAGNPSLLEPATLARGSVGRQGPPAFGHLPIEPAPAADA